MNVGAFKPEDYGHHFAWGETNFKPYDCTLEKYSLCTNGDESTCKQLGVIAGTEYDVARFLWGKDWQMPTEGQVNELCKYCTTELIQCNGVNGIRFTGVNGNSIFLPSAGYRHGYVSGNKGRGLDYWSATQKGVSTAAILSTNLDANNPNIGLHSCYVGCFVRPVLPDTTIIDFYDWNTLKAICVKNWDSNGDGELSKDEAAAVTDLGRVFYKSYIKSFNELKYFTGLTTIGWDAFNGCRYLTDITIPNSVKSIEAYAFWECRNLKAIAIPKSVTNIDSRAFRYCTRLKSVCVESGNIVYDSRDTCNAIIHSATNELIVGCSNTIIPNSVTSIGTYAFAECIDLASIAIPNSVTSIGGSAFNGCGSLTTITIPKSVTSIGDYAFYNCQNVEKVISYIEEPFEINNVFGGIESSAILYVPVGAKEKYKVTEGWNQFKEIREIGTEGDDSNLFPDCPAGEIRDAALYLYHKGIVEGEEGKLLADREAIRAEVAKTSFYGAYFGPENVPSNLGVDNYPSVYTDLQDKTTYYYRPAKALLYLEYGDGVAPFDRNRLKFDPEGKIARVNVVKELLEAFNIKPELKETSNPFPKDENVVTLAKSDPVKMGYLRKAASLGVITTANEQFHPYTNCTRGQLFLMLARIMQKIEAGKIADPKPQEIDYFQPLNTTLATISLGAGLQMGNFQHYTKTSFAIDGVVPLAFAHTYNSYNTTLPEIFYGNNGSREAYLPLGDGWTHNYHTFITNVDNHAVVHWGGGSIDVYEADGTEFKALSLGVYDKLTTSDNNFVITTKSQMTYYFGEKKSGVAYLTKVTDRNGNRLVINYESGVDGLPRIKTVTSSDTNGSGSRSLKFSYNQSGTDLITSVSDPAGRSVEFGYEYNPMTGRHRLMSFTDAKSLKTSYEYDDNESKASTTKLLTRIRLPKGNYINNTYDSNHRLALTENGDARTTVGVTPSYGSSGISTKSSVSVSRASGTSDYDYTFNGNNVMTSMSGPQNMKVSVTPYTTANMQHLPQSITTNSTTIKNIEYDSNGNVKQIDVEGDGETLTTKMTYTALNDIETVTDPMGRTTTYSYTNGNLTKIQSPIDGIYTMIDRKANGLVEKVTNPEGIVTKYSYNSYGNQTLVTLPLGLTSSASYDSSTSLLKSVTDALGRTYDYEYDENDNLKSETTPKGYTTDYRYDENDNLIAIRNAKQQETMLEYDYDTDRLTSVSFAGATKSYAYNPDGTLNTFTKPDGKRLGYEYDALGRVTSDGVNSYSYDSKLRLQSISSNGRTISFSYDGFNRIKKAGDATYSYDKNGNCTSVNNVKYDYDELNRLTSVTFSGGAIRYDYLKDGRLNMVEYPNGMTTQYGYDLAGRLTSKSTKLRNGTVVASYEFELDKAGNIQKQTAKEPFGDMLLTNEDFSCTYDEGNRITKAGDIMFEFDKNGNTTKRGTEAYSWDDKDRLTKAGSTAITYNPLGQIVSYGDIAFTTDPLGMGNVLSDSKSGAEYIYGNGLEARVKNGSVSYYVTDYRGSVVAIVDESGNITHKYQYDEFGKVTQKQEADYNPFQYVGKHGVMYLTDYQYYMRARHYDPTIGRFLSEDPIWSTTLYPYADNNPVMGIDPRGLRRVLDTSNESEGWGSLDGLITNFQESVKSGLKGWANDTFVMPIKKLFSGDKSESKIQEPEKQTNNKTEGTIKSQNNNKKVDCDAKYLEMLDAYNKDDYKFVVSIYLPEECRSNKLYKNFLEKYKKTIDDMRKAGYIIPQSVEY